MIVVTTSDAGLRFGIDPLRREDILPRELPIRGRILGQESAGERRASKTGAKIVSELLLDFLQLSFQRRSNGLRKGDAPILVALSSPNSDLITEKIHFLDSQRCCIQYPEYTPIHQHRAKA
jgi:hypothetical protein